MAHASLPVKVWTWPHLGAGLNVVLHYGASSDGEQRLGQLQRDGTEVGACTKTRACQLVIVSQPSVPSSTHPSTDRLRANTESTPNRSVRPSSPEHRTTRSSPASGHAHPQFRLVLTLRTLRRGATGPSPTWGPPIRMTAFMAPFSTVLLCLFSMSIASYS